jgi:hypothetical protein
MRGPSQTTLNNSAAVQLAATAQAHKMVASRTGSPEIQTSQNGYSGPEEHVGEAATERTGLLGNGDTSAPDAGQNGTKDNWVGFQEFEGLPWYKTPSVRRYFEADELTAVPRVPGAVEVSADG